MERCTTGEMVTSVFLCLGVAGGAGYGWFAVGTVTATVGCAVLIGVFTLLLVSVVSMAAAGIARLFDRPDDR